MSSTKVWAVTAVAALSLTAAAPAYAAPNPRSEQKTQVTLLSTTDTHGNVLNWDYFRNKPYSDSGGNQVGVAQAGTVIERIRAEEGANSVVVVDNGDTIQGTPLSYYYAKQEPITETGLDHPMAVAFNTVGYDAVNIGNHEFNYDLPMLGAYEGDLDAPLLGANVVDATTGEPLHKPFTIVERLPAANKPVKIGILGLTTPGSMVWDKAYLDGKVHIEDMVEAAQKWVPQVKAAGADIVVVLSHSGKAGTQSVAAGAENASDLIASKVPGIDAIVMGHSHQMVSHEQVVNEVSGESVALVQPRYWASSVNELTFDLKKVKGQWDVVSTEGTNHPVAGETPLPALAEAIAPYHTKAVDYVNQVIARSVQELPAAESRYRDTAIIDYIQMVQTETVSKALAGTQYAQLPVVSIAAPFSRTAVFPQGDVTIRDMAGLYIYDNTLHASTLTGAQLDDYLEYSAGYFKQVTDGTFDPAEDTNAVVDGRAQPDYNYDIAAGVNYTIDLTQPVGERVRITTNADGSAFDPDQTYVVAVNNYRRSGGGSFPHIASAPLVYDETKEIRQLLIDWAVEHEVIDPADFYVENWHLTLGSDVVFP